MLQIQYSTIAWSFVALIFLIAFYLYVLRGERGNPLPSTSKFEIFYHRTLGLIVGHVCLVILFFRIGILDNHLSLSGVSWQDFLLLLVWYISANGRLPSIAHTIPDWMRKGNNS